MVWTEMHECSGGNIWQFWINSKLELSLCGSPRGHRCGKNNPATSVNIHQHLTESNRPSNTFKYHQPSSTVINRHQPSSTMKDPWKIHKDPLCCRWKMLEGGTVARQVGQSRAAQWIAVVTADRNDPGHPGSGDVKRSKGHCIGGTSNRKKVSERRCFGANLKHEKVAAMKGNGFVWIHFICWDWTGTRCAILYGLLLSELLEHRNQMTRHNAHITTLQYNYHFLVRTCTKRLYSVWLWRKRKSWPWPSKTPRSYMHSQSTNRLKWLAGIHAGQRSRSVSAGKPEKHSGVQPISEKQRDLGHRRQSPLQ